MSDHVLIVDDEQSIRQSLGGILADEGYEVSQAGDGNEALSIMEAESPHLVLLDIWMPGPDGLEVLATLKQRYPHLPVIMISGHGTVDTAVKATRLGAFDFIEKPLDMDKILLGVRNALSISRLTQENMRLRTGRPRLTGNSTAISEVRRSIEQVAPTDSWVLIHGENGTGKEVVARSIHLQSKRAAAEFVDVNCAAIPEELIESELFGHEKGAFTGATGLKRGKFDLADGGTLLLDEIADMSLKTQAKILRILQEQTFERVGGTRSIEVDVRVLAATNKDLAVEIQAGRFRQDLYYRLNVIPISVPPLRKRSQDVADLAQEFLQMHASRLNRPLKQISPRAMEVLTAYSWPGNVRELKNLVERLVILSPGEVIEVSDLPGDLAAAGPHGGEIEAALFLADFKQARAAFEKAYLEHMLAEHGYNVSRTAEAIGLERSHLHKKIKALGIGNGN